MNPVIESLFKTVDTLEEEQTPYAVMGGLAVRIHALPRPTQAVDLTIGLARNRLRQWYLRFMGYSWDNCSRRGEFTTRRVVRRGSYRQ